MSLKNNVQNTVKLFRSLAQIPALTDAKLNKKENCVESWWSQRDLEKLKTVKFVRNIILSSDLSNGLDFLPYDVSNEVLYKVSPSEKYKAVLKDFEEKQFLEIWKNKSLYRSVDFNALDIHGKVYTDGEFKAFEWCSDESKILFIAEKKSLKSEPFYKRKEIKESDKDKITPGDEYLFKQDWGEQLVGKKESVVVEYHVENDNVKVLEGIPEGICPAQVIYSKDGKCLVGVGYQTNPRKLGLIYCSNRPSFIFMLTEQQKFIQISSANKSVKSPTFSPDGKYLLWLERKFNGPHASTLALMKYELFSTKQETPQVIVDIVQEHLTISNNKTFYGLYNSGFVDRCWASENRLILSTVQKNAINTYVIDIDTGKITELEYQIGSQVVLDVSNDIMLVNRRHFLKPDVLAIGRLPAKGSEHTITFTELTHSKTLTILENCMVEYLDLTQNGDDSVKTFSAIFVGPKSGSAKSTPLLVYPHGGPHSASPNNFSLGISYFLSLGYAVLLVNFRGSIGAGEKSVNFLLGRVGTADVSDCILATNKVLDTFDWLDGSRMGLVGGSHGGFLIAHLSGQYPDMFKAVVSINPVIDIASMTVISDIPDWAFVECGFEYSQKGEPDADVLTKMRKVSPIQHMHKVKAPTLLLIGSNDLRVSPHQATEYYHRLKTNGTIVRMNMYEDSHPLSAVKNEMDQLINSALWLDEHVK